ncbi:MAG: class I SAM-dependent methyltransferase [bacterium]|nr:class I SAM-dependent methyltransferase [bacterium]
MGRNSRHERIRRNPLTIARQAVTTSATLSGIQMMQAATRSTERCESELGNKLSPHPARYSVGMIALTASVLETTASVLDPMAGAGGIFELQQHGHTGTITASDIEPPTTWANGDNRVEVADARALSHANHSFSAVVTSPPYGNRMADKLLLDGTRRHTYANAAGRVLADGSAAAMQWSDNYRSTMSRIYSEIARVVVPGGLVVVWVKDHIRAGERQAVTAWTMNQLQQHGELVDLLAVGVPSMKHGANSELRLTAEIGLVLKTNAN